MTSYTLWANVENHHDGGMQQHWTRFRAYSDAAARSHAHETMRRWRREFGGVDCASAQLSVESEDRRIDLGVGLPPSMTLADAVGPIRPYAERVAR
jgi:hypothetical protein